MGTKIEAGRAQQPSPPGEGRLVPRLAGNSQVFQAKWHMAQTSESAAKIDRSSFAEGTAFGSPGNTTTPGLAPQQTRSYEEAYTYDPAGIGFGFGHYYRGGHFRHR